MQNIVIEDGSHVDWLRGKDCVFWADYSPVFLALLSLHIAVTDQSLVLQYVLTVSSLSYDVLS